MGTLKAVASLKRVARRWAAELHARAPGLLRQLRGKFTILMYHRVVTEVELSSQFIQPGMYVTSETFARQVQFLLEKFDILSLHEMLSMWRERTWDSERRYCVITFDDGWLDNYVHAFPVLRRCDVPATVFLPTGFIGSTMWFWPEQVGWLGQRISRLPSGQRARILASLKQDDPWLNGVASALETGQSDDLIQRCKAASHQRIERLVSRLAGEMDVLLPEQRLVMNWDEVEEMSAAKISFGSHSVAHKILTTVSTAELHEEVCGSLQELRKRNVNVVPVFCYPNGDYSPTVLRSVESAGYSAAMTTEPGWEDGDASRLYRLKRIEVHNDLTCSDALFAFHLAGYNNVLHG